MTRERSGHFYRPELDGLRFFAFLGVFVAHALNGLPAVESRIPATLFQALATLRLAGSLGVDLFFALSGYLITALLLRERSTTGGIKLDAFYVRRSLRIWPLYFVFVAVAVGLTLVDPRQTIGGAELIGFLSFTANWVISMSGTWPASVIGILWSVSLEEQFYLVWPVLTKFLDRRGLFRTACGMLIVATGTRVWLAAHGATDATVWTNTLSRLDPLACGVIVALWVGGTREALVTRSHGGFVASGIAVLLASCWLWDREVSSTAVFCYPVAAIGVTVILIGSFGFSPLRWRLFVELGKRSYGLYVYHALGFYLAERLLPPRKSWAQLMTFRGLALGFTLALAFFSYGFLEKPFLRLKRRFTIVPSRDDAAGDRDAEEDRPMATETVHASE